MYLKKTALISLVSILFVSKTFAQEGIRLTEVVKQQLIDSLSKVVNRNYVYPDKAVLISNSIRKKHRGKEYEGITDHRGFANRLTKDIKAIHKDNHLSVRYDPDLEKRIRTFETTLRKDTSDFDKERRQNFFFKRTEILRGNIGYINFTNFADTNTASKKTAHAAFQFIANADALILDLRNNLGGRAEMGKEITAYFFNKPQFAGRSFNRMTNQWTDEWIGDQHGSTRDLYLTMPLYILTSERTFSAAEGFTYNLKYLKNAVVVGDTTRGGAHRTRSFPLGHGYVGFIPYTRGEHTVTKTDWEGIGVIPDVPTIEELSLIKAQELILTNQLSNTTDSLEKSKLQWLLNDLHTRTVKITLPEETLKQYTGAFEEFLFTLEDGRLYCRNTLHQDKKDMLVAINEQVFKIDEQSHVQFVTDKKGVVKGIRLLWDDGWVDTIKRSE